MYSLSADYKVTVTIPSGVDRFGKETPIESIVFSVDKPEIIGIEEITETSCTLVPLGIGTCQFKVEADAHIGEGVKSIVGLVDLEVIAGEAVTLNIVFGTPVPIV